MEKIKKLKGFDKKKQRRRKEQKGITLIALVITIIVLLILAAVSIATLTGENGILTKANQAREDTKREGSRERIEVAVMASYDENGNFDSEQFKKEIEKEGGKVLDENEDKIVVEVDGYEVTVDAETGEILNVEKAGGVRPQIEVNLYTESGETLEEGKSYDTVVLTVKVTNESELGKIDEIIVVDESGEKQTEIDKVGDGQKSFKVAGKGKYTITVRATTENVQKSASITTSVKVAPAEWKTTTADDKEWYDYGATVNKPKLVGDMTPIKYTGDITDGENKWANAITADGSMWVWIPRYAYKITKGYHTKDAGTIDIKFLSGTGNTTLDGSSETILTDLGVTYEKSSNEIETNDKQIEFLVHPAFTGVPENGGWKTDVTGIWVAKFEPTDVSEGQDKSKMAIKAGVRSLTDMTINKQYQLAKGSTFGESLTAEQLGSHMAKNSEWGAVAYLSQSKYGRKENSQDIEKNTSSNYYTGGSNTKTTIYTTNKAQSTTGNATGIYDMVGGAHERVASYIYIANNSYLETNGGESEGDLYGADENERSTSDKYKTVYKHSNGQESDYNACGNVKGDAIYETSNQYGSTTGSWHNACAYFPYSDNPFFERGGSCSNSNAGSFFFSLTGGAAYSDTSFRVVLVP